MAVDFRFNYVGSDKDVSLHARTVAAQEIEVIAGCELEFRIIARFAMAS